ncbi:hypothetical protein YB2330_003334 [Saitoella coloradoensis]
MRNIVPALLAFAATTAAQTLPQLDLSSYGNVLLGGDFAGLSPWTGSQQSTSNSSATGDSVLSQLEDGRFESLGQANGTIASTCFMDSGVFIAGNFTGIAGVNASNIAVYNISTLSFSALGSGVPGPVYALYCNTDNNTVVVGGDYETQNSSNALTWSVEEQSWVGFPFGGFNGPVTAIAKAANGDLLFGGSFDATGTGATGSFEDSQAINLVTANVTATGTTALAGFNNASNILCPGGTGPGLTWLLADDTAGSWTAEASFGFRPTMLRLYNARQANRGTKTFRIIGLPINGIMNMTYTDPTSGDTVACDAFCPLPQVTNDSSVYYTDFHFVNVIGMTGLSIEIQDWYGVGGGLDGLTLYQDDILAFAVNNFNQPTCYGLEFPSFSNTTGGPWSNVTQKGNTSYLTTWLTGDDALSAASVSFSPETVEEGNFTVQVHTPGCLADDTCSNRGQVDVSVYYDPVLDPVSTVLFQTNNGDKYDTVYQGVVAAPTTSWRPYVVLAPVTGQSGTVNVVAQSVQFLPTSAGGGLRGLFEYNPANFTTTTTYAANDSSVFDRAGETMSTDPTIAGIAVLPSATIVVGNFSATSIGSKNVLAVNETDFFAVTDGGLNGPVNAVITFNGTVYVGGNFTASANGSVTDLNHIAVYDSNLSLQALGQGVNGEVTSVVQMVVETSNGSVDAIGVSGTFTAINTNSGMTIPVNDFAAWIPNLGKWAQELSGTTYFQGSLASSAVLGNGSALYVGSVGTSEATSATFVARLPEGQSNLTVNALNLFSELSSTANSAMTKRAVAEVGAANGVYCGVYYNNSGTNLVIIGGHFSISNGTGSVVQNLAFIAENGTITGTPDGLDSTSSFYSMVVHDKVLYAGGNVTGTINGQEVNGLVAYDLNTKTWSTEQFAALTGDNVQVNDLAIAPDTNDLVAAGTFTGAGSLSCPAVCFLDLQLLQWSAPTSGVSGDCEKVLFAQEKKFVAAGNMTINGTSALVLEYDLGSNEWGEFANASTALPGPVTSFVFDPKTENVFYLAGENTSSGGAYLEKWDGTQFTDLGSDLQSSSVIHTMRAVPLVGDSTSNGVLPSGYVLLIMGRLDLPNYGNVSAATFNGSAWQPYLISSTSDNVDGQIYVFIQEKSRAVPGAKHYMDRGFVILISLAIAVGIMLLLTTAGALAAYWRRRSEGYVQAPSGEKNVTRIPPGSLFSDIPGQGSGVPTRGPVI